MDLAMSGTSEADIRAGLQNACFVPKRTSAGLANANLACIQRKSIGLTKL
jgi:hypothetical protein